MRNADAGELARLLRTRDDLVMGGWARGDIDRAVQEGRIIRLRRGRYAMADDWEGLWPESRHRMRVLAVHADATGDPPVFGLISAAAVLRFPLHRVPVDRVHTMVRDVSRRTTPGVIRHAAAIADSDIVEVGGLLCTSPERTMYDLARLARAETALVCADAVLAVVGGHPRRYDESAAEEWRGRMHERVAASRARGIRHARAVIELADGRSQLPLESVTKLQLHRLGFRRLGLQARVPRPGGRGSYWMDIELEGLGAFYECDGETKYTDAAQRSGRTLDRVLLDEKAREDWVRGTTGKRVLRGGSIHSSTPEALGARLVSFGVSLPPRRDRLILPSRPLIAGL